MVFAGRFNNNGMSKEDIFYLIKDWNRELKMCKTHVKSGGQNNLRIKIKIEYKNSKMTE